MELPVDATRWSAARTLREQGMPPGVIRAVLAADDPDEVRWRMALHQERLDERAAQRRRALGSIERCLTESLLEHRRRGSGRLVLRARGVHEA
jgi:hypothetical protein